MAKNQKELSLAELSAKYKYHEMELHEATRRKNIKYLDPKFLEELTPKMLLEKDEAGIAVLWYAVERNSLKNFNSKLFKELTIEDLLVINGSAADTILHKACRNGSLKDFGPEIINQITAKILLTSYYSFSPLLDHAYLYLKDLSSKVLAELPLSAIEGIKNEIVPLCTRQIKFKLGEMDVYKFILYKNPAVYSLIGPGLREMADFNFFQIFGVFKERDNETAPGPSLNLLPKETLGLIASFLEFEDLFALSELKQYNPTDNEVPAIEPAGDMSDTV